jgi:chemotaxis protein methyltransferase CheR
VEESIRHFENARALLDNYQAEDVLPESDGMTARRLREIIELTLRQEAA